MNLQTDLLLYICLVFATFTKCHPLKKILKYYETIKIDDVTDHIVRRSISEPNHQRKIKFKFSGKEHHLHLRQNHDILSPDFKAFVVDAFGKKKEININKNIYYKGVLEGDENSTVIAHVEGKIMNAEIISSNGTVFIEPLHPHAQERGNKDKMIVYRLSDVIENITYSAERSLIHTKNCGVLNQPNQTFDGVPRRHRRSTSNKNICLLKLVADYKYFSVVGLGDSGSTVNYMVQVISRVDDIYKNTEFTGVGENIGFKIIEVEVHAQPSSVGSSASYNVQTNGAWNVDKLLTSFSRMDWSKYCLAHLFTYQDFSNGIIGLAYVASEGKHEIGGICTNTYRDMIGPRYLNCGLSSNQNWGRRLLTAEADLVTAHELGHNFGSSHDPRQCQPQGSGGNFIMYSHSVSGEKQNNNQFSSCSKDAIGKVLASKKDECFVKQKNETCGNNVVEGDEECDVGFLTESEKCCNSDCKLKNNPITGKKYKCSDGNDACCTDCQYANSSKVCRSESKFHCTAKTYCSGFDKNCSQTTGLNNSEPCGFEKGNCREGKCVPLCVQKGKETCTCVAGPSSCKICCKDAQGCRMLDEDLNESDGAPCFLNDPKEPQGQCVAGVCKKSKKNVEDEFSSLFSDFTFDKFVRFMKNNIVGTILIFSLLIWVPASVAVNYIDKKQGEESQFMINWDDPKNKRLLHPDKKKRGIFFKNKPVRTQFHIST